MPGGDLQRGSGREGPARSERTARFRAARTQNYALSVRYFWTRSEKESFLPVDNNLGLGYLANPAACRAFLDHCAQLAKLFGKLGGRRRTVHLTTGSLWKEKRKEESIREVETVLVEAGAVSLDGVRPDRDEEARWCEASCSTVSFQDADA